MQPTWTVVMLLSCFGSFNSPRSKLADAAFDVKVYSFTKYRSSIMSRMQVYKRPYTNLNLEEGRYYHGVYSYIARVKEFHPQTSYSSSRKCGNFETNLYGDFIGYYQCPLFFEPKTFIYCCGLKKHHYCCSNSSKSNPYTAGEPETQVDVRLAVQYIYLLVVVGFVCVAGIVSLLGWLICSRMPLRKGAVAPSTAANSTATISADDNNDSNDPDAGVGLRPLRMEEAWARTLDPKYPPPPKVTTFGAQLAYEVTTSSPPPPYFAAGTTANEWV